MNDLEPLVFEWKDDNMSTGIIAQEITSIDLSDISITSGTSSYVIDTSAVGTFTITSADYSFEMSPSRDEFNTVVERLEKLEKVLSEEAELRSNHPALKNAYDEYRLLLVLSKAHPEPLDK